MTDDLPTVLQHMAPTRQQAVIRFCANRGAPDLATLLATSAQELSKAPGVGPSTIAEVQSILGQRGASLRIDPVELTPHEDPRTRKVTDLWAAVHRDIFPGVKVTWEPRARYHLDERRAVDIAECAQGHGRDRIAFDAALGQIEVAFRAYLGHLTERRNWPHEPTLAGFANAQKLPGRFTGAATPKLSGRAGNGQVSSAGFFGDDDDREAGQWTGF